MNRLTPRRRMFASCGRFAALWAAFIAVNLTMPTSSLAAPPIGPAKDDDKPIVLDVDREGRVFVGEREQKDLDQFFANEAETARDQRKLQADSSIAKRVVIRADNAATCAAVCKPMKAALYRGFRTYVMREAASAAAPGKEVCLEMPLPHPTVTVGPTGSPVFSAPEPELTTIVLTVMARKEGQIAKLIVNQKTADDLDQFGKEFQAAITASAGKPTQFIMQVESKLHYAELLRVLEICGKQLADPKHPNPMPTISKFGLYPMGI